MRLFLNPGTRAHLRGMAEEFHESTNSIRVELNRFEEAGMLISDTEKNKKLYRANPKHPLYNDIKSILIKYIGLDKLIESIIPRLGNLQEIGLTGDYAHGKDSGIIDLLFIGEEINTAYLSELVYKAEKLIGKKIKFLSYEPEEWLSKKMLLTANDYLILWEK